MYFKAYLQTQCPFAWHHGKIKRTQPRPQKEIVGRHKSGSSLKAISKRLKVPRSSVQTIIRKYKHHGTTQPSYCSGWRRVVSLRDERTLVWKVQIQKYKRVQKYLYPQQNESYIDITWKAAQQGRSHCSKTAIKKPDYGFQLHMGTKIVLFGEMSSGLMKQKYNCLAIMTIVMFGGKRGGLQAELSKWTMPPRILPKWQNGVRTTK